ncbi:Rv3654c family TadE-like protein [Glycomyces buryatensis]|uniref:Putative Flp pilus-assembly TadG-like N-terminal domain-containing protein n=1 Tax=Glycomyces buryatensis TaxID=2570927 RepID=A0A4V4HSG1_9ACTN|nr:Rv3654c family TadE-like protein [Glycomyces buryatensis]THV41576.1 hypothetical protein FAB82_10750 [Glycomyces buryatensis]
MNRAAGPDRADKRQCDLPNEAERDKQRPNALRTAIGPRDGRRAGCGEEGSATVLAVGVVAALVVSTVAFAAVGQATAARHRAQGAADAAALAGAAKVLFGDEEACAAAAAMVAANSAELESCEVNDLEVTIRVTEEANGIPRAFGPARAVSRAGPVTAG